MTVHMTLTCGLRGGRAAGTFRPLTWSLALILAATPTLLYGAAPSRLPAGLPAEGRLWEIGLGSHQYTTPKIDRGRMYVGIDDMALEHPAIESSGGGILLCLDPDTGMMIWQLPIPRNMEGTNAPFHFNHWKCGVCSTPATDGDRVYIVGPRGDVLCLDRDGQANGNGGPFLDDAPYMGVPAGAGYRLTERDGDILWRFDMIQQLKVVPHDVCGSSPIVHGDYLYACTSNGVDDTHRKMANPQAPSLIVLDKRTGHLAGTDGQSISHDTLHGNWSSPVAMHIHGKTIILFGGGDGVLYAFQPLTPSAAGPEPRTLTTLWTYDCCPADYRERDGKPVPYSRWNDKSSDGPSEIIATPVVHDDRVYLAIGQSPIHGPGRGMLSCIDGETGQRIWATRRVDRTLCNAAIHDGLLYIPDYTGRLFCLDADTGDLVWQHDMGSGAWCASPVVADGKVYISTEKQWLWILKAGREKKVLSRSRVRSMAITPMVQQQVLYLPTQRRLFAVDLK